MVCGCLRPDPVWDCDLDDLFVKYTGKIVDLKAAMIILCHYSLSDAIQQRTGFLSSLHKVSTLCHLRKIIPAAVAKFKPKLWYIKTELNCTLSDGLILGVSTSSHFSTENWFLATKSGQAGEPIMIWYTIIMKLLEENVYFQNMWQVGLRRYSMLHGVRSHTVYITCPPQHRPHWRFDFFLIVINI